MKSYNDEYINGWSTKIDIYPGIGYWATYDEEDDNSDAEESDCFETFVDCCCLFIQKGPRAPKWS